MATVSITIDGKSITADTENSILEAANKSGIYIPRLCSHPDLKPAGECRVDAVQIEGQTEFVQACMTKVAANMVVHTDTPAVRQKQMQAVEKIMERHPNACLTCWRRQRCKPDDVCLRNVEVTERCVTCPENGHCELQRVVDFLDFEEKNIPYKYPNLPIQRDNPYFDMDYNLCIACGRCVRACRDLRGIKALDFKEINGVKVAGPVKATYAESGCKYCFTCVEVCPVGALVDKQFRYRPVSEWDGYVVP